MAKFGLALVVSDICLLRFSALVSIRDGFFACDFPELDDLSLRTLKPVLALERGGLAEGSIVEAIMGRQLYLIEVAECRVVGGCGSKI
jgi:hypothetical protein